MALTKTRRSRRLWGALLVLGLLLVAVFPALRRGLQGREVAVRQLAPTELVQTVVATGRVSGLARVEIGSLLAGTVTGVSVREGDRVEQGAVLVRLGDQEARASLAQDLGASVGDKVRLAAAGGRTQVVTVAGVFDLGLRDLNRRWVLITLRSAQTLLDLAGGVTNIDLAVNDLFGAEAVAKTIAARTGLVAESWMQTNAELLAGLRGQSGSSAMIQFFVSVAVAFGISSVLVVSVVQKSREIGILRAMGASRRAVLTIFLVQGAIVALAGSLLGCALGTWAALAFQSWQGVFHVWLGWQLYAAAVAGATAIGIVAALAPAFRAAHLEPVAAIRYGG